MKHYTITIRGSGGVDESGKLVPAIQEQVTVVAKDPPTAGRLAIVHMKGDSGSQSLRTFYKGREV